MDIDLDSLTKKRSSTVDEERFGSNLKKKVTPKAQISRRSNESNKQRASSA